MRWGIVAFFLFTSYAFADLRYLTETTPAHTSFDTSGTFTNISVEPVGDLDDGYDADVSLGFDFPFNGTTYQTITIDTNGRVLLDANETVYNNISLSDSSVEMGMYPYWDDLDASNYGEIKYQHLGIGSSDERFVVWWDDVEHYKRNGRWRNGHYSFQVVLYKDGRIRFRYTDGDDADGNSATIGAKEDDTYYDQHLQDSNTLDQTQDILYIPTVISGYVYEDPNGDSQMGDQIAKSAVTVTLYDNSSILLGTTSTDSNGAYQFYAPVNEVVYVVVDSTTVVPSQVFSSGNGQGDIWAEQTYGGIGAECADGSGSTAAPRSTAGSCFGGRGGDTSDDASSLGSAEHRIKITTSISTHSYSDRDLGFSFNVVTSIRDGDDDTGNNRTIQGSLRQFIQNANALSGANTMRFVPSVAKNETSWWKVTLGSDLPTLSDDDTFINGTAYSLSDGTTIDNSNSGTLLMSGHIVGAGVDAVEGSGDEHTLPTYEDKELEIDGVDKQVFALSGDGIDIVDLSIYNTATAVSLNSGSDNNIISRLYLGSRADGSAVTGGDRLSGAFYSDGNTNGNLFSDNYVTHTTATAVYFSGRGTVTGNYFYSNATNGTTADALTLEGGTSAASRVVTVTENYIDGATAYGIESWNTARAYTIEHNTLINTGNGGVESGAIRIFGQGSILRYNVVHDAVGAGIVLAKLGSIQTDQNIIQHNVIYDNGGLSIDLDQTHTTGNPNGDGVSPNNGSLNSSNQNNDMDYPVIASATYDGSTLHIEGYVGSAAGQSVFGNAELEVYIADDDGNNDGEVIAGDGNSTAHGEGKRFFFGCSADGSGNFSCDYSSGAVDTTVLLTMTATLNSEGTSEFSANYPIVLLPEMHVNKTSCVINDPVNNGTDPKRIPGATIRYAIEVSNTGLGTAGNVIVDDNISSVFDAATITNLSIDSSHACNCLSPTSAGTNGANGGVSGNHVKLDFDTVSAGVTECGYFDVDIR